MPTTTKKDKDLLARLADAGEDAIVQLTKTAAGKALTEAANQTRVRLDELSRRVRGVESLETRVTSLEKQVASLKKASRKPARKAATSKPATPKPEEPKS